VDNLAEYHLENFAATTNPTVPTAVSSQCGNPGFKHPRQISNYEHGKSRDPDRTDDSVGVQKNWRARDCPGRLLTRVLRGEWLPHRKSETPWP
jgi:hypothetical protein